MRDHPYSPQLLHEQELIFAEQYTLPTDALKTLHELREQLNATGLPASTLMALWVVTPVLAGFTGWLNAKLRQHNSLALGVMREGGLLCRLLRTLCGRDAYEIDVNRNLSMLAASAAGDGEALVNWLTRARLQPLSHGDLAKLYPAYGCPSALALTPIDLDAAQKLVADWRVMGAAAPLHAPAESARENILRHWENVTAERTNGTVALMDFACAGNIQRSLQAILRKAGNQTQLIGLNFLTTKGAVWAKAQGCEIYGFMAEDGQPAWIAEAYTRGAEVMEVFTAAPVGPLTGYTQAGNPLRQPTHLSEAQQALVQNWQDHIITAAKVFYDGLAEQLTPDLCRCIWGRLLLVPLPTEVFAIADWPIDTGLDDATTRSLAPLLDGSPEYWIKTQTGWPAASLVRQQLRK